MCGGAGLSIWSGGVGSLGGWRLVCVWIWKPLFSIMSRMVSDSLLCFSFCRLYVFSL